MDERKDVRGARLNPAFHGQPTSDPTPNGFSDICLYFQSYFSSAGAQAQITLQEYGGLRQLN